MRRAAGVRLLGVLLTMAAAVPAHAAFVEFNSKATFLAAAAGSTVIDFDAFAVETVLVGNEFAASGLTVTQLDGFALNVVTYDPSSPPGHVVDTRFFGSVPNALSSSVSYVADVAEFDDSVTDSMRFEFTSTMTAAGLYVGQIDTSTGTDVTFLDGSGTTILAKHIPIQADKGEFVGIISDVPIKAIETTEPAGDGDAIFYDDIIFGTAALPIPATSTMGSLLLGLGLMLTVGITLRRWK